MKLTAFTDYSLRVLIYLAAEPGRRATIAEIASAYGISENHLVKVVHFLAKKGWIASIRGRGGGLELGRPTHLVRVGQVVRDTEGPPLLAECFESPDDGCRISPHCGLKGVLAEAVQAFYGVLDRYTLADLVSNREQIAQVLFMRRPTGHARGATGAIPGGAALTQVSTRP